MRVHRYLTLALIASVLAGSGCASRKSAERGEIEVIDRGAADTAGAAPRESAPGAADMRPQPIALPPAVPARGEPIHFAFDSWLLGSEARETLAHFAEMLPRDASVLIEGHADERGTTQYNVALGARRADAVREYLVRLGVSPERLSTISYGAERPAVVGSTEEAWAKNRRAELDVTAVTAAAHR
jgi:peptidoglycan-associated lipoprotein